MDLRVKRTLQLIQDAMIGLMGEQGFERMTVRDITERAMINRATFYLHYEDKYDLLHKMADGMLAELTRSMELPPGFRPHELNMDEGSPPPSFVRQFEHLATHAAFYRVMLGPMGQPGFAARMEAAIREALYARSALAQPNDRELRVPRDLIIRYCTSAHLGIVMQWLEQGMPYTPHYMATQLKRLHLLGPTRLSLAPDARVE